MGGSKVAHAGGCISLQIPDDTGYLHVVRRAVRRAASWAGFGPIDALKITMAVDEACVNIIEHGYETLSSGPTGKPIRVNVEADREQIRVSIRDAAPQFAPQHFRCPSLEEYARRDPPKGLGLRIIQTFVDYIEHSYQPGKGNTVRLVKYRSRS